MRVAKQIFRVLATGYILMFYSELVFWAHVRPDDSWSNWVITWLAYSFLAFIFLTVVARFRIHTIWALFLAEAVFGLLAEGVLVKTTYESLPLSISFTALAWHALISVWVGWVAVNQVLSLGLRQTALLSAAIGLFFGFWSISWWIEPAPEGVTTSLTDFAAFAIIGSLILVLAYWIYRRTMPASFMPNRIALAVAALILLLFFIFVAVPAAPIAVVVLPALLLLIYVALRHNRQVETRESVLSSTTRSVPPWNYLGLLALPLTAIGFYAAALALGLEWRTNWIAYLITTPLGFILLVVALVRVWQMKEQP